MQDVSALSAFFSPRSVAVVGASSDPKKPGHTALRNMIAMGYKGKIFPVNPREPAILDLPCYKSVLDIPEPVEACALMVSSDLALSVAKELAERKRRFNDVAAVVCMSAGFGELNTPEGTKRERDLVETLRSADIRMVGPNCVGVMNTVSGFNTNFDIGAYPSGGISVLTQSGAFGNAFLFTAGASGRVGLNKFVSVGNMADVQMTELAEVPQGRRVHPGHRHLSGRPGRSARLLRSRPRGRCGEADRGSEKRPKRVGLDRRALSYRRDRRRRRHLRRRLPAVRTGARRHRRGVLRNAEGVFQAADPGGKPRRRADPHGRTGHLVHRRPFNVLRHQDGVVQQRDGGGAEERPAPRRQHRPSARLYRHDGDQFRGSSQSGSDTSVQGPERRCGHPNPGSQRVPRSAAARQGGRERLRSPGRDEKAAAQRRNVR